MKLVICVFDLTNDLLFDSFVRSLCGLSFFGSDFGSGISFAKEWELLFRAEDAFLGADSCFHIFHEMGIGDLGIRKGSPCLNNILVPQPPISGCQNLRVLLSRFLDEFVQLNGIT